MNFLKNKKDKVISIALGLLAIGVVMSVVLGISHLSQKIKNKPQAKTVQVEFPIVIEEIPTPHEIATKNMNMELESIREITDKHQWFVEYKNTTNKYSDIIPTKSIYETYSQQEIELMWRCVETECHGQSFMPKVNVASVILNRLCSERYANSIVEIITSPNQFAYFRTNIDETTKLAVEYAILFGDSTNGCVAFRSNSRPLKWCSWQYQFTDECGHNFYK